MRFQTRTGKYPRLVPGSLYFITLTLSYARLRSPPPTSYPSSPSSTSAIAKPVRRGRRRAYEDPWLDLQNSNTSTYFARTRTTCEPPGRRQQAIVPCFRHRALRLHLRPHPPNRQSGLASDLYLLRLLAHRIQRRGRQVEACAPRMRTILVAQTNCSAADRYRG